MILLILLLLMNVYILKKYEKGYEHFYSFLFALILTILYYYEPILIYVEPIRLFFEMTMSVFLFFQIYFPLINKPKEKDMIVVLGCGLIDKNRISPLLMNRCNIAIEMNKRQSGKILVSGGKGKDEDISEALAMKTYLVEKGINEGAILCEDQSKSTKENLVYSKEIVGKTFNVVTSDYHAFRVYILSKLLGLDVGIYTSKTIYYYKFYALAREYLAIIIMFKEIMFIIFLVILYFNHSFLFNF